MSGRLPRRGLLGRVLALIGAVGIAAPATPADDARLLPSPELLNRIGNLLVDLAGTVDAKIVLHADFAWGTVGQSIMYVPDGATAIKQAQEAVPEVSDLLFEMLDEARAEMGDSMWREMIYVLDHGKVSITLLYAEQVDEQKTTYEKVDAEAAKHFPGLKFESDE